MWRAPFTWWHYDCVEVDTVRSKASALVWWSFRAQGVHVKLICSWGLSNFHNQTRNLSSLIFWKPARNFRVHWIILSCISFENNKKPASINDHCCPSFESQLQRLLIELTFSLSMTRLSKDCRARKWPCLSTFSPHLRWVLHLRVLGHFFLWVSPNRQAGSRWAIWKHFKRAPRFCFAFEVEPLIICFEKTSWDPITSDSERSWNLIYLRTGGSDQGHRELDFLEGTPVGCKQKFIVKGVEYICFRFHRDWWTLNYTADVQFLHFFSFGSMANCPNLIARKISTYDSQLLVL